jgi:5-methylcytosine-specific restriction endonuclease McrA
MTAFHRTKEWYALTRKMRPLIKASLPQPCVDCHRLVEDGEVWELGHIHSAALHPELALEPWNLGPSHRRCNRKAGGRMGAAKTNATKQRKTGEPNW